MDEDHQSLILTWRCCWWDFSLFWKTKFHWELMGSYSVSRLKYINLGTQQNLGLFPDSQVEAMATSVYYQFKLVHRLCFLVTGVFTMVIHALITPRLNQLQCAFWGTALEDLTNFSLLKVTQLIYWQASVGKTVSLLFYKNSKGSLLVSVPNSMCS